MPPIFPATIRFRALDGWRGVCALLVAAHHLEARGFLYWQPLVRNAWLFVDFFFVLSGFVIAHAYGAHLSTGREVKSFVLRRFGRLWPLHVMTLLALIGLELAHLAIAYRHPIAGEPAAFSAGRSPFAILTNLLLIQSLGLHSQESWNGPAWSISTEFYTYVIFATVAFAAPKFRLALSLLLAAASVAILARFSRYGMRETFDWGLMRCIYGFFVGVLTYETWKTGAAKFLGGTFVEVLALAIVLAFLTFLPGHFALEFLATPLFALAVLVFAGEQGLISRLLISRPAAALGRWSYSIYMVHTLVLAVLFSALHSAQVEASLADGAMVAYLAAVIALAALTWRLIERPGQRFFTGLASQKSPKISPQIT